MKTRLLKVWDTLRATFWFIPTLMAIGAVGLAFLMVALDEAMGDQVVERVGWVWSGGPEGAREILSSVASSMITVAGTVFSITLVVLSLASSQYSPRVLPNFLSDKGNQVALGSFVATFVYSLLVLRTIRGDNGDNGDEFVPAMAIRVGLVLAVASLGVLIYFIHHVAVSIQAGNIIGRVSKELNEAIERLFPEKIDAKAPASTDHGGDPHLPPDYEREARGVRAVDSGYLQAIDLNALKIIAADHDCILQIRNRPGHFVIRDADLVLVWPGERVDEPLSAKIQAAFIVGEERTIIHDLEFAVSQLVEIAVRALSPGVNDPFIAMQCLDRLAEALGQLAERRFPSPYQFDDRGQLRIMAYPTSFADVTDAAFNQIRQYSRTSVAVTIRLLEVITHVATRVQRQDDRAALLRQAIMIERGSREGLAEEWDRRDVQERFQTVLSVLDGRGGSPTQQQAPV